nr:MAG TPA: hypothetical protein [Caudoviricetes sp.]
MTTRGKVKTQYFTRTTSQNPPTSTAFDVLR